MWRHQTQKGENTWRSISIPLHWFVIVTCNSNKIPVYRYIDIEETSLSSKQDTTNRATTKHVSWCRAKRNMPPSAAQHFSSPRKFPKCHHAPPVVYSRFKSVCMCVCVRVCACVWSDYCMYYTNNYDRLQWFSTLCMQIPLIFCVSLCHWTIIFIDSVMLKNCNTTILVTAFKFYLKHLLHSGLSVQLLKPLAYSLGILACCVYLRIHILFLANTSFVCSVVPYMVSYICAHLCVMAW